MLKSVLLSFAITACLPVVIAAQESIALDLQIYLNGTLVGSPDSKGRRGRNGIRASTGRAGRRFHAHAPGRRKNSRRFRVRDRRGHREARGGHRRGASRRHENAVDPR